MNNFKSYINIILLLVTLKNKNNMKYYKDNIIYI